MISRRQFITGTIAGAGCGAAATLWSEDTPFPDACALRRVRLAGPAGWSGRRIAFVTDVHYGFHFGPAEAGVLSARVRALRPHAVALGGDLAETPETDLADFFARWSPGCPTFFAPGNHDLAPDLGGTVLPQARAAGLTVLCNAAERWEGLTLIGLPSALMAEQRLALLRAPGPKLVLGHEPDCWDAYREPDLTHLAGHTHAGQIRFLGRPLRLPTLGTRYPWGEYRKPGGRRLIVSAGIGCVGVPARINCPPEIVTLEFGGAGNRPGQTDDWRPA
jgi:uncharacterized protein